MMIPIEDMKLMIQEWFAQADSLEDLIEIFYAVRHEAEQQYVLVAKSIMGIGQK